MEASYAAVSEVAEEASQIFVGRWQTLVSTTNWEKGRIIQEWREALIAADAPASEYSDEAWSRRLGTLSAQHAGRLRRTYSRFGTVRDQYPRLYWSHFQAALDWNDAEMWLEGAVQNRWSVSEMRRMRGEALGEAGGEPLDVDEVVSEEFDSDAPRDMTADEIPRAISATQNVLAEEEAGGEALDDETAFAAEDADFSEHEADAEPNRAVRPFAQLADLPADLADAVESFKLAILRHKLAGWSEVAREDVIDALEALKQLALAAS